MNAVVQRRYEVVVGLYEYVYVCRPTRPTPFTSLKWARAAGNSVYLIAIAESRSSKLHEYGYVLAGVYVYVHVYGVRRERRQRREGESERVERERSRDRERARRREKREVP